MKKNISILYPKSEFTSNQLQKLSFAGQVSFVDSKSESSLKDLIKLSKDADILAFSPDKIGKNASEWLSEILEKAPNVKGLALNTVHADYVNAEYCKERGIRVFTVSDYKIEAVAEHVLLLLLGSAKRLFINDRRTYRRRYLPELGFEIIGRRLGVIGSDQTAARVVQRAKELGMAVYATERFDGAYIAPQGGIFGNSDFLTLHLPNTEENKKFLNKERISILKDKAIVINLSGREIVDENEMRKALLSGHVSQYLFEGNSLHKSPLEDVETAIMFKEFSGNTFESRRRRGDSWVINISNLAGKSSSYRSL
ncbi:MAG: NAD(P)-dependent oxidoreductase [Candidatus Daviesbacteria bacterium]|nr:NAD(P)-dependent oxidoreductase [Candidatus Daviesbacteria bacterium]